MPASALRVRWKGRLLIAGPADSEDEARRRLEELLYDGLSECEYLNHSLRDAYYAERLASETPYIVRGRSIVVKADIEFWYRNPPGHWKPWATIKGDGEE